MMTILWIISLILQSFGIVDGQKLTSI